MEVDNEPGNCISDDYNLFLFECTGFHIYWTLLQTLSVGYSKPGASGFLGRAGRFWPSFAQLARGFFQESCKVQNYFKSNTLFTPAKHVQFNCVKLNEHQKQRTEQLNFLYGTLKYWDTNLYFHCVEFEVDKHWLEQLIIHSKEGLTFETSA